MKEDSATTSGSLHGAVALVTGADNGIGTATCRELARQGATVVATDRTEVASDQLPAHCAVRHALDVTDEGHWERVVSQVVATYGGIDILVNNAGVARSQGIEDENEDGWGHVLGVNLHGPWLGMKAVGPGMAQRHSGAIINVASILAVTGGFGDSSAYHAAKGGVVTMTKNAAVRWGHSGVRVNAVLPGFIGTKALKAGLEGTGRIDAVVARTPLGRLGTPEEVAGTIAFLASPTAAFVTGVSLLVDGGMAVA